MVPLGRPEKVSTTVESKLRRGPGGGTDERGWHAERVSPSPSPLAPTYIPVPEIAIRLGIVVTKVHQLIRERQLIAVRTDGVLRVPAEFVDDGLVVKGLPGTITLLTDGGYRDEEIIDWLFTPEDSLPGSPIDALRANRGREVHRRAQAAGY
jgi:hypothetical protein